MKLQEKKSKAKKFNSFIKIDSHHRLYSRKRYWWRDKHNSILWSIYWWIHINVGGKIGRHFREKTK